MRTDSDDEGFKTVIYEQVESVSDIDEDVRVSSVQLGIVRYSHTQLLETRTDVDLVCSISMLYIMGECLIRI